MNGSSNRATELHNGQCLVVTYTGAALSDVRWLDLVREQLSSHLLVSFHIPTRFAIDLTFPLASCLYQTHSFIIYADTYQIQHQAQTPNPATITK